MSQIDEVRPHRHAPLDAGVVRIPACLDDREVENFLHFSTRQEPQSKPLALDILSGDGTRVIGKDGETDCVSMCLKGGTGSYQLRLGLPEAMLANGVGARIRLRGWKHIDYIGIGYTLDGYRHVKAANPIFDQWFDFVVGHNDLAWGWRNQWDHPPAREITDIRLYIKGETEGDAFLDVTDMFAWEERDGLPEGLFRQTSPIPVRTMHAIRAYQKKCFRTYETQARQFMETGTCPLYGGVELAWPTTSSKPTVFLETGTYQFSFHAQHPAIILMLQGIETGEIAPIMAARDQISLWLENSFFTPDENIKYAWYDHGSAERCLAMVQMYALGEEYGFDHRFMSRLRLAIFRHAQLLASEVFYAGHQPIRYHNHAWFQDLTLLAVCLAFPSWRCAQSWTTLAITRLEDQFEKLIVRDGGYSVFVENSIGYHHGVQRIVEFAGNLAVLSGRETTIPDVARELLEFADFFRYPDARRTITQGDTFRLPNPEDASAQRGKDAYGAAEITVLPKAGYGIVKDDHDGMAFMLVMLATALSSTHKHEDNLAVTLYFDGLEWLLDPSFHSHEYVQPIPAYLRSAAAHNDLYLSGLPYTIKPGHAGIEGGTGGGTYCLEGWHDAYEGAYVTRRVTGREGVLDLEICDAVKLSKGVETTAALMLHCGEGVRAKVSGQTVTLRHPLSKYTLVCEMPDSRIEVKRGVISEDEIRGITGHTFMKTAEIDTIETTVDLSAEIHWRIRAE